MNLRLRCLTTALAVALVFVPFMTAQQADTALIVGTISDATGAVVPGANLTFAHLATGTEYNAQTNESGSYRSPLAHSGGRAYPLQKSLPASGASSVCPGCKNQPRLLAPSP